MFLVNWQLEYWAFALSIVTWITTLVGWLVVSRQAKKGRSSAEVFQIISSASDLIEQIKSNATRLWMLTPTHNDAQGLRVNIVSQTTRLSTNLNALRMRDRRFNLKGAFVEFKNLVTGDMTVTTARPKLNPDKDPEFVDLADRSNELILAMHSSFNAVYRRKFTR